VPIPSGADRPQDDFAHTSLCLPMRHLPDTGFYAL
jgi:hypothetical protein